MPYYNNGFPVTYQPQYQYQAPQAQQAQPNSIIWVSGEAGAKSYLVAPNNSIVLFDSESQTIYIKSADASGMPSMKVLDYTIRETGKNAPISPVSPGTDKSAEYATKDEIKAVSERIDALTKKIKRMEDNDDE